jgi:cytochrome P450
MSRALAAHPLRANLTVHQIIQSEEDELSDPDDTADFNPDDVNVFTPEIARCPQATYALMRDKCPVLHRGAGTPFGMAIISRFDDVMFALRNPDIFSSAMDVQMALGTERPMIPQQIDPPEQTRFRKLLDPYFSRKRMSALAPKLRAHANELIDSFYDEGECEFDAAFAIPLPCIAFLDLMGLPHSDLDLFLSFKDNIIRPQKNHPDAVDHGLIRADTGKQIYAYFEDVLRERRANPTEDFLGYLVQAEIKGDRLTETEMLDICFLQILAGLDTVTATLGCNLAYLAENPAHRQQVVDDPGKWDGAIEELLRWESPVTAIPRVLKQDVTLRDIDLKKGEMVTLLIGAANTDDDEFGNAQDVDFARSGNRHIAFGAGAHRCLGSHLARMELVVALEEWHKRIPQYQIKPGETPAFSAGIREALYLPLVWKPN